MALLYTLAAQRSPFSVRVSYIGTRCASPTWFRLQSFNPISIDNQRKGKPKKKNPINVRASVDSGCFTWWRSSVHDRRPLFGRLQVDHHGRTSGLVRSWNECSIGVYLKSTASDWPPPRSGWNPLIRMTTVSALVSSMSTTCQRIEWFIHYDGFRPTRVWPAGQVPAGTVVAEWSWTVTKALVKRATAVVLVVFLRLADVMAASSWPDPTHPAGRGELTPTNIALLPSYTFRPNQATSIRFGLICILSI